MINITLREDKCNLYLHILEITMQSETSLQSSGNSEITTCIWCN